ncbi:MAG: alpha/beta hydrolase [Actinomycetes bacterium]
MPVLPGAEPFRFDGGPVGVLLCHGFTGSPQSMRPWGEHLASAGLTVSCPRLPGHGTRWQELNLTGWQDWYAEIVHAFDDLAGRCDQVFAMGLSMGGTLALRLAERRPNDVAGLVLVNPSVMSLNKALTVLPVLKWMVPSLKGVGNDIKREGVTELAYDRTPMRAAHSLAQLWKLVRSDLGDVVAPVLVYRSVDDHVVEPVNTETVLAGVASPAKEERLLRHSYHVATLDNDAPEIFEGSLDFVRSHTRAPSES